MADRASSRRPAYGNRFVRAGLPLVTLVVGGWLGLAQLVQGKTEVQDARRPATDERLPATVRRRKTRADLAAEHARLKEAIDINSYENKPVPRYRS